jgi:hypothetical protein
MSQAYDNYIQAKKKYDDAEKAVQNLIDRLGAFATPLIHNWRECYIDLQGQGNPMSAINSINQRINGNGVPDAMMIHHALLAYREAERIGHQAWTNVPADERKELVSPPWQKKRR